MAVDGIHHIYVETHNWGASVAFWRALGYELTDDYGTSGILRAGGDGPYLFLEEVPEGQPLEMRPVFNVVDAKAFEPNHPVTVIKPFQKTHWDTAMMEVRDPDGRIHWLQDPTGEAGAPGTSW